MSVAIEPLKAKFLMDILRIRNIPSIRKCFLYDKEVSWSRHIVWYESYKKNPNDFVFAVKVNGKVVGQVSIYNIDACNGRAEVGRFMIDPKFSGRGVFRAAYELLEKFALGKKINLLYLEVKITNKLAVSIYGRLGFSISSRCGLIYIMEKELVCG